MLRLAIVGLGAWGRVLVDAVNGHSDRLKFVAAVVRRPEAAREDCAKRGLALHARLDDVLDDAGVDAIVLCTPHGLHRNQILACAAAGKPVFCEKPLTMASRMSRTSTGVSAILGSVKAEVLKNG